MAQTIKLKRSATQNAVPTTSQLALGEVALNTYDGKMYIKKSVGGTESIVEIGGDATSSSGLDFTGNLNLADDVRIVIGDGNDLQIFHDGSHSYIKELGTGNLRIDANDFYVRNAAATQIKIGAEDGGAVKLYYAGVKKFETTSTGVTITGNIAVTGTVDGRDLATDGSKLDNIESNADVTDTANVTAAGALMDSEVTNLAQVKAFDSSDYATAAQGTTADSAMQDLVDDTTPQLGGNLDLNSNNITGTGNISNTGTITSTDKVKGASLETDRYIYHAGDTNTYIDFDTDEINFHAGGGANQERLIITASQINTNSPIYGADSLPLAQYFSTNTSAYFGSTNRSNLALASINIPQWRESDGTFNDILISNQSQNATLGTISSGNITTTGYLRGPSTFTIDPATHGDDTGTVVIAGNLQVDGTTTTINSTTLTVDDKNITLASGSANAAASANAGITVDCGSDTDATILYSDNSDSWNFNKEIRSTAGEFAAYVNGNRYVKYRSAYNSAAVADFELKSDNNSLAVARITGTGTANLLQVFDNTTQVFTIEDGGNVGIGTTSPEQKLHLDGGIARFSSTSSNYLDINANAGTGNEVYLSSRFNSITLDAPSGAANPYIGFRTAGTTWYKIDHEGNFKRGTNTLIDASRNLTNIGTISSGAITSSTGTVGTSPNTLKIITSTEANTAQGDVYAALEFHVTGADNNTGTLSNSAVSAIKAIDYRSGTTSFEDAGIGFYTLDTSASAPVFRGGFSNAGGFFVSDDGVADNNTGQGDIYAIGNISAGNNIVFNNQLRFASDTLIDNQKTFYINTIAIPSGDFVVTDGNNSPASEVNIIWRDHSADRLYLGTTTDVVEFRGDVNFQSGHTLSHDGNVILDASRNLTNIGTISSSMIQTTGSRVAIGNTSHTPNSTVDIKTSNPAIRLTDTAGGSRVTLSNDAGTFKINKVGNELVQIFTNGNERFSVETSGAIRFNDAFTFPTTDGSANQVLKTDGSGNVTWATEAAVSASTSISDADGDTKIQVEESSDEDIIRFDTAGTERMVITSSGNVGINNASPAKTLTVGGTFQATGEAFFSHFDNISNASRMRDDLRLNFGTDRTFAITGNSTNMHMKNGTADVMTFDTSNRVGIGTTNPSRKLDISASANDGIRLASANALIGGGASGGDTQLIYWNGSNAYYGRSSLGGSVSQHEFRTAGTTRLTIDSSGDVGIGITAPTKSLHVNYTSTSTTITDEGLSGGVAGKGLLIQNASTDTNSYANLDFRAGTADGRIAYQYKGTTNVGDFHFITDNAGSPETKLFIKDSGYVGINNTDPTLYGTFLVSQKTANNVGGIAVETGTVSARLYVDGSGVRHLTAGTTDVINWTSSGNVGIGTSSPSGKLDVLGTVKVADTNNPAKILFRDSRASSNSEISQRSDGRISLAAVAGSYGTSGIEILSNGNVGIGTTSPAQRFHVVIPNLSGGNNGNGIIVADDGAQLKLEVRKGTGGVNANRRISLYEDGGNFPLYLQEEGGNVGIGLSSTKTASATLQVEELGIDTTTTSTTATTQVAIDTFAAATFRSARYTIQVTNSTDSTYHITEILLIHDGTTPQITEYGTIFTGSAEATFDADISSGNVRLLATPATTDSMTFKVVRHCITV